MLFKRLNILLYIIIFGLLAELFLITNGSNAYVYFLDVDQGDSTLIRSPEDKYILIDTGNGNNSVEELGRFFPVGKNTIDLLVVTHFDNDHIGSLENILRNYHVLMIAYNEFDPGLTGKWATLLTDYLKINIQLGEPYILGCCIEIDWLYYGRSASLNDSNDYSLAFKLKYIKTEFFFGGDLSGNIENSLAKQIGNIEVLKVSHHGSKSSTSEMFISIIKPDVAVLSVGKENIYGHPDNNVLNRLRINNTKIFRTDIHGSVVFELNGEEIKYFDINKCRCFCNYLLSIMSYFNS